MTLKTLPASIRHLFKIDNETGMLTKLDKITQAMFVLKFSSKLNYRIYRQQRNGHLQL